MPQLDVAHVPIETMCFCGFIRGRHYTLGTDATRCPMCTRCGANRAEGNYSTLCADATPHTYRVFTPATMFNETVNCNVCDLPFSTHILSDDHGRDAYVCNRCEGRRWQTDRNRRLLDALATAL